MMPAGRTVSEVRLLDESRRIEELARMIDGGLDNSGSSSRQMPEQRGSHTKQPSVG